MNPSEPFHRLKLLMGDKKGLGHWGIVYAARDGPFLTHSHGGFPAMAAMAGQGPGRPAGTPKRGDRLE